METTIDRKPQHVTLPDPLPPLLTTAEAMSYLRLGRSTFDKLCKQVNGLKRTELRGCIRYKLSELQRFVDRKTK